MTEQTSEEPDPTRMRFLSKEQYREMVGEDELDRQLRRLIDRHRDPEQGRPGDAAGDPGGPP